MIHQTTHIYRSGSLFSNCYSSLRLTSILKLRKFEFSQLGLEVGEIIFWRKLNSARHEISRLDEDLTIAPDVCRALIINYAPSWHCRQILDTAPFFAVIRPIITGSCGSGSMGFCGGFIVYLIKNLHPFLKLSADSAHRIVFEPPGMFMSRFIV
jgi:hypothetical protein